MQLLLLLFVKVVITFEFVFIELIIKGYLLLKFFTVEYLLKIIKKK